MNVLVIEVDATRYVKEPTMGIIIYEMLEVRIHAKLFVNGYPRKRLNVTMQCPYHGQEDARLRDELIQSQSADMDFYHERGDDGKNGGPEWQIKTIDPSGILRWLGLNLTETMKKQHNDKPIHLSLAAPGG